MSFVILSSHFLCSGNMTYFIFRFFFSLMSSPVSAYTSSPNFFLSDFTSSLSFFFVFCYLHFFLSLISFLSRFHHGSNIFFHLFFPCLLPLTHIILPLPTPLFPTSFLVLVPVSQIFFCLFSKLRFSSIHPSKLFILSSPNTFIQTRHYSVIHFFSLPHLRPHSLLTIRLFTSNIFFLLCPSNFYSHIFPSFLFSNLCRSRPFVSLLDLGSLIKILPEFCDPSGWEVRQGREG